MGGQTEAAGLAQDESPRGSQPAWPVFGKAWLAGLAVLFASLANFLTYHDYPLVRLEVVLAAAGLAIVAAVVATVYLGVGRLTRALLEALLVFVALDLNMAILWPPLLVGAVAFAICYFMRTSVLPFVAVLATIVLSTTLVGLGERRPAFERIAGQPGTASSAPAVVHLILDEHVGTGGMSPALRAEFEQAYAARGFRLFRHAYSRHFHTVNAIPDILNFGGAGSSQPSRTHLRAGPTAYLSLLAARGYGINIYESDFADFCSDVRYASCNLYWSPSMAFVDGLQVSAAQKARLISFKFWGLSNLARGVSHIYNALAGAFGTEEEGTPRLRLERWGLSSTLSGLAAFDALTADLRRARPGNVYFAHLLVPHYPYVTAADCSILPPSRWEYRRSSSAMAAREGAYRDQLRCTLRKLDGALAALAASPAGRDAIVVIHGDHGSRISAVEPTVDRAGLLSEQDLVAGFSTLFAVRAPGIAPGVDAAPAAAPDLLGSLARSGFSSVAAPRPRGGTHSIVLDDRDWIPRQPMPLPDSWQQPPR